MAETGLKLQRKVEIGINLSCCKYNINDEIVLGTIDGRIVIPTQDHKEEKKGITMKDTDIASSDNVSSICINGNHILATYSNGMVKIWDQNSKRCLRTTLENRRILGLTLHPQKDKFITYAEDPKIYLHDLKTGILERIFAASDKEYSGHSGRVFAAKFHPSLKNEFISGSWDEMVHFWDTRVETSTRCLKGPQICGKGLDINSTGEEILTCSNNPDETLQLWNYKSGEFIRRVPSVTGKLLCGKWLSKKYIATGGTEIAKLSIVNEFTYEASLTWELPGLSGVTEVDSIGDLTGSNNVLNCRVGFVAENVFVELKAEYTYKR